MYTMQSGDFIYIDFTGRVKDTKEVFDVTDEKVAQKENIYSKKVRYGQIPVIVDGGFVLKGLDEALLTMKIGDKKTVTITPEKAFGERKTEMIKLMPMATFKEQNIDPTPGGYVNINNFNGRVISVNGGRVNVDFNHPLAGKSLEYEVEVKSEVKDLVEKIKCVVGYFLNIDAKDVEVALGEKSAEVKLKGNLDLPGVVKKRIADTIFKWVKEVEKLRFTDEYSK